MVLILLMPSTKVEPKYFKKFGFLAYVNPSYSLHIHMSEELYYTDNNFKLYFR